MYGRVGVVNIGAALSASHTPSQAWRLGLYSARPRPGTGCRILRLHARGLPSFRATWFVCSSSVAALPSDLMQNEVRFV